MNWIKVSDALPEINADGYSRYVLVYSGYRLFPEIAQYSPENTTFLRGRVRKTKTHWWSNRIDHSDRNGPLSEPTHWCDIVFPEETKDRWQNNLPTLTKNVSVEKFCEVAKIPLAYFYAKAMTREDYIIK